MLIAFTGAGISKASGIPTFADQPGIREKLTRPYATRHPEKYAEVVRGIQETCDKAEPNDAHVALAEHDIPVITMNVDNLHVRAGSKHVLAIHGVLPNPVLYNDPAPLYQTAFDWVSLLRPGDTFLIIGTSFYTNVSEQLKRLALMYGADVQLINDDAEHEVRRFLDSYAFTDETFEDFMARQANEN